MKPIKNKLFLSVALAVLALAAEVALVVVLYSSRLLPDKYMLLIGLGLAVITGLGVLLALGVKKLWIVGDGLLALLLAGSLTVGILVNMGVETLRDDVFVTLPVEEDIICVMVNEEDPAKKAEDLGDYTFGIMAETDLAESEGMLSALLEGEEIQAAIFNPVYLSIASDMMDGTDLTSKLKSVFYLPIEALPGQTEPSTDATTKPTVDTTDPQEGVEPFAVYITGIDGGYSLASKSNADVNILVVVNPKEKQVMLLNTPRDYYIEMPVKDEWQPDKLSHCGCYGIDVSMQALEKLYGISIKHYFKVNFNGFQNIINALGGITVYSDYSYTFKENGYKIVKGYNKLDGMGALVFARERHELDGGDESRGKNQLKIIKAVLEKAMSPALLLNYTSILNSLEKSFATDVPYDLVASLVRNVIEEGAGWEIFSRSVSGTNTKKWLYSLSKWMPEQAINDTMLPNAEQVQEVSELMAAMLRGEKVQVQ